jgi:quercetin dioxygenase-like cupin family protein
MFAVPENTIALPPAPAGRHPARIATDLALDRSRWWSRLRYDPVERFALLLERADDHEAWLLTWLPGQATEPHDHGGGSGAFTIVSGVLTEWAMRTNTTLELRPGQSRVFAPGYVHQVSNAGSVPAVSIHVFQPARAMRTDPHGTGRKPEGITGIRPGRKPGSPLITGTCEGADCVEHGSGTVRVDRRPARRGARGHRR